MAFVMVSAFKNFDGQQWEKPTWSSMSVRLLVCYLFHLCNFKDLGDSAARLKYLRKFPKRFDRTLLGSAWTVTFY